MMRFINSRRYEDASLEYTGVNKHEGEDIGLFSTVLTRQDYERTFVNEDIEGYDRDNIIRYRKKLFSLEEI